MLELTEKYIIKNVPTIFFRTLPPKNFEISNKSNPGNFSNNLQNRSIMNKTIAVIYIIFNKVADFVSFIKVLGNELVIYETAIERVSIIALIVPILD